MIDRIKLETSVKEGKATRNRKKLVAAFNHFEGKDVVITIERKKRKRSIEQNRSLWGIPYALMLDRLSELGNPMSKENLHIMMRQAAAADLPFIYEDVVNNVTGEVISTRMRSSTEWTTSEAMDYYAFLQKWSAEFLDLDVPSPNEQIEIGL